MNIGVKQGMKSFYRGLVVASCMLSFASTAHAQAEVRFATGMPDSNPLMEQFFTQWVADINKNAEGKFALKTFGPPFANPTNVWERVTSGVADMGLVLLPFAGVPFDKTMVLTLPAIADDTAAASSALWHLYESGLIEDEFKDVHLIGLFGAIPAQLITKKEVTGKDALAGLRIRVSDRNTADAISALGASPISMPFSEVYQAMSRGVIDAAVTNSNTLVGYKLSEVTSYQVDNISFGMVPVAIVMNKQFYEAMPEDQRAIINDLSGAKTSLELGKGQQALDSHFRASLTKDGGFTYVSLSDAEVESWKALLAPISAAWAERTDNGQAILDTFVEQYKAASTQ